MGYGVSQSYQYSGPMYSYSVSNPSSSSGYTNPSSGSSFGSGTSGSQVSQALLGRYDQQYATALRLNQQNYQNILSGYQSAMGALSSGQHRIDLGYGQLSRQVQQTIHNVGGAQRQAIQDTYATQWGQQQQRMLDAGLGNSTVIAALQRGTRLDEQKAEVALADQIAQLQAGYQSQVGLAGLAAREQGLAIRAGLSGQYLGVLGNYRTPYPTWPGMESFSRQASGGSQRGGGGRQQSQGGGGYSQQSGGGGYAQSYSVQGVGSLGNYYGSGGGGGGGYSGGTGGVFNYSPVSVGSAYSGGY